MSVEERIIWNILQNGRAGIIVTRISVMPRVFIRLQCLKFDRNIYYLNCQNGTLDLQTGEFHPHTPQDKLTKIAGAAYDSNAKSLRFIRFISEVMSGDKEKARFMQKSLGYGLTGDTRYECMFFYYGATTRNGKGTLMESTLHVMGDYGLTVRPETIAQSRLSTARIQQRILPDLRE